MLLFFLYIVTKYKFHHYMVFFVAKKFSSLKFVTIVTFCCSVYVLYFLKTHIKFHVNKMLFTI